MDSAYLRLRDEWLSGRYGHRLNDHALRLIKQSAPLNRDPYPEESWRYDEGVSHIARACECYLEYFNWSAQAISDYGEQLGRIEKRLELIRRSAEEMRVQFAGMIGDIIHLAERSHPSQARKLSAILNLLHTALLGVIQVEFDDAISKPARFDVFELPYQRFEPMMPANTLDFGADPADFITAMNGGAAVSRDSLPGLVHLQSLVNLATALLTDFSLVPYVDAAKSGAGRPRWASPADFVVDLAIGYERVWKRRAEASSYETTNGVMQTSFSRLVDTAFDELRCISPAIPRSHLTNRAIDAALDRARNSAGVLVLGN